MLESPYNEEQNRSSIGDPDSFAKFTANKKASALVNELIKNSEHPDIVIGGSINIKYIFEKPNRNFAKVAFYLYLF